MSWITNPVMEWSDDNGTTWNKVSDHGRSPLSINIDRIGTDKRMADGTLRRYVVAKKKTIQCSWEKLPNTDGAWLANGKNAAWMETWYENHDASFLVRLRAGADRDTTFTGVQGVIIEVMITDFSKDVVKRGLNYDMWDIDLTLEEV